MAEKNSTKIPFEHLHDDLKLRITELKRFRRERTAGLMLGPVSLVYGLAAKRPLLLAIASLGTGIGIASQKSIAPAMKKIEELLGKNPISEQHVDKYNWQELKKRFPYALVNRRGDVILTHRKKLLGLLGRKRLVLRGLPREWVIPFSHLHASVQEEIEKLKETRITRGYMATVAGVLTFFSLKALHPGLVLIAGAAAAATGREDREVRQAIEKLGEKLRTSEERFVVKPLYLQQHDWETLKQNYPFAYVKASGDLVLTTRNRLFGKIGRLRAPLRKV